MEKIIRWNPEKARILAENTTRKGISFESCAIAIDEGDILDIIKNPSSEHPNQRCYVLHIDEYVFMVPFVENNEEIFLKTIIPSKRMTKKYLLKK